MIHVDVAVIGGGICGCALQYELSRYRVSSILLERENDVSIGTTKANSAIVHAGYDPLPGTSMARYNVEGNALVKELCRKLDVPCKETGSLVPVSYTHLDVYKRQHLHLRRAGRVFHGCGFHGHGGWHDRRQDLV